MRLFNKFLPPSLDQAILFMIIISLGIGYPVFETLYGGKAISLTDILTILFAPRILYRLLRNKNLFISRYNYGPLILLVSFLISILIHLPSDGIRSLFGWMRPAWLFITVSTLLSDNYEKQLNVIYDAFVCTLFLSLFAGFIAIVSYLFFEFTSTGILVRPYYFGLWPVQLAGLDGHPNGAAQFIIISIIIIWFLNKRALKRPTLFIAVTGLLLTLSKSILIYGAMAMVYFRRKRSVTFFQKITITLSIMLLGTYLFFSHFYPVPANKKDLKDLNSFIIERQPVFQFGNYSFYETIYSANKIAAVQAFISSPISGIGPGNYIPFVQKLKLEGKYPDNNQFLNPHCTYTSIAARFGLIGIIGLIFCLIKIYKSIQPIGNIQLKLLFSAVYIIFALDAITSDLEYARMFWFFNAWIGAHLFCQSSLPGNHEQQSTQYSSDG